MPTRDSNVSHSGSAKSRDGEFDDTLRPVPEVDPLGIGGTIAVPAFILTRLQALEKPTLEEELIEPDGGSGCACNSVCSCVPVDTCACNEVCPCDTVATCQSYNPGGGGGGFYAPCH